MELKSIIKVLKGEESLLLILPKEVNTEINIEHGDLLEYNVQDNKLIITRIDLH
ncbi:hypothetical protein BH23THE1_BH23THE1_13570 [soil metagenome]